MHNTHEEKRPLDVKLQSIPEIDSLGVYLWITVTDWFKQILFLEHQLIHKGHKGGHRGPEQLDPSCPQC